MLNKLFAADIDPEDRCTLEAIAEFGGAPDLQVTFAPSATEQEIREVLQSAGTVIVDGPSALGIYGLRLADPEGDAAAIEAALVTLQARGDVVTFAEKKD